MDVSIKHAAAVVAEAIQQQRRLQFGRGAGINPGGRGGVGRGSKRAGMVGIAALLCGNGCRADEPPLEFWNRI